ncbi:hypothetical protein H5410_059189 [Solanum commersonii]|uniref:Uncharacterized protein n=1 Tax=Solanum commersonii TaxID=4109 RepID=A0A9J5W222_SOLCO|nr:hypothetical protein H5410_059189 [Solanum commersonii]
MGQREGDNAMAAKEPVACEREDSITSHPGLPCQDTGQIGPGFPSNEILGFDPEVLEVTHWKLRLRFVQKGGKEKMTMPWMQNERVA